MSVITFSGRRFARSSVLLLSPVRRLFRSYPLISPSLRSFLHRNSMLNLLRSLSPSGLLPHHYSLFVCQDMRRLFFSINSAFLSFFLTASVLISSIYSTPDDTFKTLPVLFCRRPCCPTLVPDSVKSLYKVNRSSPY